MSQKKFEELMGLNCRQEPPRLRDIQRENAMDMGFFACVVMCIVVVSMIFGMWLEKQNKEEEKNCDRKM